MNRVTALGISCLIVVIITGFSFNAFAQGIDLTNIQTSPSQVHVGDSFGINATVVNNSPNTIYFNGGCQSPLSAAFDKNVAVGQAMGCFAIFNAELKPGQNATIVGPDPITKYKQILILT